MAPALVDLHVGVYVNVNVIAFITGHEVNIVDTDGIPWWSPSEVLVTNYFVCKCMCVRV